MIIEWIAVAIIIAIGIFFIQIEHHARKFKIAAAIILGVLLYFSIAAVLSSEEVDLTSPKSIANGVYLYAGWVGQTATNLWDVGVETTHMVGSAIRTDSEDSKEK